MINMVQKELLLNALREQLKEAESLETKIVLNTIIGELLLDKYAIRIWD
jgi:hypothetical protein